MNRQQLDHLLRAASTIVDEQDVVVFGSQAILGTFPEDKLPPEATFSIEADFTFFNDPNDDKSDAVDGAIGELSNFHETFGMYAQGVSITTAVLPEGWRDRLVTYANDATKPGRGLCLEPHDLAISKLVAGREKDYEFVQALLRENLLKTQILSERLVKLAASEVIKQRIAKWLVARQEAT